MKWILILLLCMAFHIGGNTAHADDAADQTSNPSYCLSPDAGERIFKSVSAHLTGDMVLESLSVDKGFVKLTLGMKQEKFLYSGRFPQGTPKARAVSMIHWQPEPADGATTVQPDLLPDFTTFEQAIWHPCSSPQHRTADRSSTFISLEKLIFFYLLHLLALFAVGLWILIVTWKRIRMPSSRPIP